MAKVSICIPTYNNCIQVKRCLLSIAGQSYQDFEVIITDDSTDGELTAWLNRTGLAETVPEECGAEGLDEGNYAPLYGRVKYYHNSPRKGPIFNWNYVLSKATGEYIKIMFSDDWFAETSSLERFVQLLEEHPEAGMAFCGSRQVPDERMEKEQGIAVWDRSASNAYVDRLRRDYRNFFLGNEIGTPSAVIYRAGEGISFDEKSNWASDMFLYFEILKRNPIFAYTQEPLICVGMAADQYTYTFKDNDKRKFEDYYLLYEKYELRESELCREYFRNSFLIPYYKGPLWARRCGIQEPWWKYTGDLLGYIWEHKVIDYVRALLRKAGFH